MREGSHGRNTYHWYDNYGRVVGNKRLVVVVIPHMDADSVVAALWHHVSGIPLFGPSPVCAEFTSASRLAQLVLNDLTSN